MLWIPSVDEIPLSILDAKDGMVSVAVKRVGEATEALHNKKNSEIIGVRGPFGSSFTLKSGRVLMIGGGTGNVPLLYLAKRLAKEKVKIKFVTGAKTKEELLFLDELYAQCGKENVLAITEDGSYGFKGLATQPLEAIMAREKFDMIYACGPEQMVRKAFSLVEKHGIRFEASLERLMRCAIGVCGSCVIGKYRVCRDGPVFTVDQLRTVKGEFGFFKRDFEGKKIPLE